MPGEHNVLNALAALGAAAPPDATSREAARALADFQPGRPAIRTPRATRDGARVFDDYAHHPTEVEATLRAARALEPSA